MPVRGRSYRFGQPSPSPRNSRIDHREMPAPGVRRWRIRISGTPSGVHAMCLAWPRAQVMLLTRRGPDPVPSRPGTIEVRLGVSGVAALILTALAFPSLLARMTGGHPPRPGPQLAALAPVAVLPAVAAVVIAATTAWWLTVLLALPAAMLLAWQLPPPRPRGHRAAGRSGPAAEVLTLRVFTVNVRGGWADPGAVLRTLRRHDVDVLAVQELTARLVNRLAEAGLTEVLPSAHLDPRLGSAGAGLWARWPLHPLPPLPGLAAAAPRAGVDLADGLSVTLALLHAKAPTKGRAIQWQSELALLGSGLAGVPGPQIVAGDFNASRDHRPFRDVLAAGFLDCADAARRQALARIHLAHHPGRSRQRGSTAVPGLAEVPENAAHHAPGPCTGIAGRSHGARGADHPDTWHRSPGRAGRH